MGLAVRGLGENPRSADSAGIGVTAGRLLASTAGMMLIAVGGAYLPLVYAGTYTEGMVAGRGWLVIALAFLGGWRPLGILAGSIFFAGMDALGLRAQAGAISIPYELLNMMPYVATLLVMVFASRWARPPQWLGRNFERGSRVD
jgi:simple sugar transport system permease protein